ncbi:MAG: hypothetical protein KGL39_04985 [Patescibacteria group bacterium]|nr:hypothetical protein [Patescibacteria group bacterium]
MAKPEYKKPEGVHVRQPEPETLFDDAPAKIEAEPDWLDLPTAPVPGTVSAYPYDGRTVWLTPDGAVMQQAIWRSTREFKNGRWVVAAGWYGKDGGGRVPYDPLGYRQYVEPVIVWKKKT